MQYCVALHGFKVLLLCDGLHGVVILLDGLVHTGLHAGLTDVRL